MENIAKRIAKRNQHMLGIERSIIANIQTGLTFKSSTCENPFEQLAFLLS